MEQCCRCRGWFEHDEISNEMDCRGDICYTCRATVNLLNDSKYLEWLESPERKTGWKRIADLAGGVHKGEIFVLAGKSGIGQSKYFE